jgi:hypothetical protein
MGGSGTSNKNTPPHNTSHRTARSSHIMRVVHVASHIYMCVSHVYVCDNENLYVFIASPSVNSKSNTKNERDIKNLHKSIDKKKPNH